MRANRARRPIRAALAASVLATALTMAVACTPPATGGSGGTTTTAPSADPAHCPTAGAGQVRVAVVVDFASLTGAAGSTVTCVVVPSGASGVSALAARATRLGTPAPRYNSSGLLCAIDGLPAAPACGTPNGGSFDYWSYWVGGSSWTYSTVGPGSRGMTDGAVEGWRFVSGGTNVAPRGASSFASLTS
jgi:hypothetical protein